MQVLNMVNIGYECVLLFYLCTYFRRRHSHYIATPNPYIYDVISLNTNMLKLNGTVTDIFYQNELAYKYGCDCVVLIHHAASGIISPLVSLCLPFRKCNENLIPVLLV